jgi:hypothetical protein
MGEKSVPPIRAKIHSDQRENQAGAVPVIVLFAGKKAGTGIPITVTVTTGNTSSA